MRHIPRLLILPHIPKRKNVQPRIAFHTRLDRIDGHQDCPGDGPDGEEDACDHVEEADEEVGVEAVGGLDCLVGGVEDCEGPGEEGLGEGCDVVSGWVDGMRSRN